MFINYLSALLIFTFGLIQCSDGKLDAAVVFRDADTNRDGFVSPDEFRTYMVKEEEFPDDQINEMFSEFDTNNDGRISMAETTAVFQSWTDQYNKDLQQWFQRADTNGDGILSLSEVLKIGQEEGDSDSDTIAIFNAADTNGDKMLSNAEFMNYDWGDAYDD